MRRKIRIAAALCVAMGLCGGASAQAQNAAAPSQASVVHGPYIVADAETGRVYEDFDANRPWYPASTTKLMTVYVTFRAIAAGELTLDSPVTISAHAASERPSKMGFKPGTVLSLDNALKMMLVKSANDIAMAVAETVGGSQAGFAERMNAEARRLGMTRSYFVNPNGWPDERQVTTARDMAVLGRALLTDFPQYRGYFRIPAIRFGKKVMKNYNLTLLERYPGATGMKTGFICSSGYNVVASARRGDREVIAVVFGAYEPGARAEFAAALMNEGFQPGKTFGRRTTLENVSSGRAYTMPFDMRPLVCSGKRATTASEAGTGDAQMQTAVVSHLGAPIDLGPPVPVSIGRSPSGPPTGAGGAFVARIPRPRPVLPGEARRALTTEAFMPEAAGSASEPAQAIGAAAGAPMPLLEVETR
jgi:D-alanyl-D-alanine carboxypeptidase